MSGGLCALCMSHGWVQATYPAVGRVGNLAEARGHRITPKYRTCTIHSNKDMPSHPLHILILLCSFTRLPHAAGVITPLDMPRHTSASVCMHPWPAVHVHMSTMGAAWYSAESSPVPLRLPRPALPPHKHAPHQLSGHTAPLENECMARKS